MIIHVDMDAFYASVEQRDNPELKQKPVIVGGTVDSRGVVSAASYEARQFGVRSAMPSATASKLCPEATVIRPRMKYYSSVSEQINTIFHRFTPLVEPLSLDEAFLDVTRSSKLFGSATEIGRQIKSSIQTELDLPVSIGIAPNKFVAKIASDIDKPNGFVCVEPPLENFLDPLPVVRLWGVGVQTRNSLEKLGIQTIHDFRNANTDLLKSRLGNVYEHLLQLARGEDSREVVPESKPKSISRETTFHSDVDDPKYLESVLLVQVQEVATRLRAKHLLAKTVGIKLRYQNFETMTRDESFHEATDLTQKFWNSTLKLIRNVIKSDGRKPVRLIGVHLSSLQTERSRQTRLFSDNKSDQQRKIDEVVDEVNSRFGRKSLRRGIEPD